MTDVETSLEILEHIDAAISALERVAQWYVSRPWGRKSKARDNYRKVQRSIAFWQQVRDLHVAGGDR